MSLKAAEELVEQLEDETLDIEIINAADWIDQEPPTPDQVFEDLVDAGDKMAIIGSSKLRKSFFSMQLCLCLAAGRSFLDFKCVKARKVLLVQMEVQKGHYHRRVNRMARHLEISSRMIAENLDIINGRGIDLTVSHIKAAARQKKAEFILIDPLYKLVDGDENSAHDMKPILCAFDEIAEHTGAAVAYVHHDPKGRPGDRDIRDRGAGSGVLGRDYDACITLTRHRDDEQAAVVETLLRNYKPRKPFVAEWNIGYFQLSNLPAVVQNSGNAKTGKNIDEHIDEAIKFFGKPTYCQEFDNFLHDRMGLSVQKTREVKKTMLLRGLVAKSERERKKGGGEFIGLPDDIERLNEKMKQGKLSMVSADGITTKSTSDAKAYV